MKYILQSFFNNKFLLTDGSWEFEGEIRIFESLSKVNLYLKKSKYNVIIWEI